MQNDKCEGFLQIQRSCVRCYMGLAKGAAAFSCLSERTGDAGKKVNFYLAQNGKFHCIVYARMVEFHLKL